MKLLPKKKKKLKSNFFFLIGFFEHSCKGSSAVILIAYSKWVREGAVAAG